MMPVVTTRKITLLAINRHSLLVADMIHLPADLRVRTSLYNGGKKARDLLCCKKASNLQTKAART